MTDNIYNVKGRIFNIQKFSVHDGPGIRTTVFLKGCVLRCRWCCNPESQNYKKEIMITDGKETEVGYDVTVEEIISDVLRDRVYYRRSGTGGITLSGGECLCQPEFTYALLRAAKENGISTAIESTACANYEVIKTILPYLDYFLMDIKHTDGAKHKEFTGKSNELMLENAKKIAKEAKELIIRVPVIPTFNDTEEEIAKIAEFTSSLEGVKELHLLPYHRFGQDKYERLGREYLMKHIETPSDEKMQSLLKTVEKYGLKSQIGG
ncbi:MAG: glycyl-radical enzyme activating protein [Clostridia bacterium]|nr:glycyl-radical enzyme activating protein [Clostridia bacterium]